MFRASGMLNDDLTAEDKALLGKSKNDGKPDAAECDQRDEALRHVSTERVAHEIDRMMQPFEDENKEQVRNSLVRVGWGRDRVTPVWGAGGCCCGGLSAAAGRCQQI